MSHLSLAARGKCAASRWVRRLLSPLGMRILFVLLLATLADCSAPGERADGGACPAGETCSNATPNGLYFTGASTADQWFGPGGPMTTAVGGTQVVTVRTGQSNNSTPYSDQFEARSSGAALAVDDTSPPEVTLDGKSAGSVELRILDGAGALLDRIQVSAAVIDHATFAPSTGFLPFQPSEETSWALWHGVTDSLIARLYDSGSARLADEKLSIKVTGAKATRSSWDAVTVSVGDADAACELIAGDGSKRSIAIPVVDAVDSIDYVSNQQPGPVDAMLPLNQTALYCFRALRNGLTVCDAPWQMVSSGGITAALLGTCVSIQADKEGPASFTVSLVGQSLQYNLTVVPAKPRAVVDRWQLQSSAAAGERAR